MQDDEQGLTEMKASLKNFDGGAYAQDLENVINAVQGVGSIEIRGHDIHVGFDRNYVSEDSLRMLITKAGYPLADQ